MFLAVELFVVVSGDGSRRIRGGIVVSVAYVVVILFRKYVVVRLYMGIWGEIGDARPLVWAKIEKFYVDI